MTAEILTSIRELDSRVTDGIQVRLLWCKHDESLWVAVLDTKSGGSLRIPVNDDERPLDVFHHPYAYAAHHGITTIPAQPARPAISLAA